MSSSQAELAAMDDELGIVQDTGDDENEAEKLGEILDVVVRRHAGGEGEAKVDQNPGGTITNMASELGVGEGDAPKVSSALDEHVKSLNQHREKFRTFIRKVLSVMDQDIIDSIVKEFDGCAAREDTTMGTTALRIREETMSSTMSHLRGFHTVMQNVESRCSEPCRRVLVEERERISKGSEALRSLQMSPENGGVHDGSEVDLIALSSVNDLLQWAQNLRGRLLVAYRQGQEDEMETIQAGVEASESRERAMPEPLKQKPRPISGKLRSPGRRPPVGGGFQSSFRSGRGMFGKKSQLGRSRKRVAHFKKRVLGAYESMDEINGMEHRDPSLLRHNGHRRRPQTAAGRYATRGKRIASKPFHAARNTLNNRAVSSPGAFGRALSRSGKHTMLVQRHASELRSERRQREKLEAQQKSHAQLLSAVSNAKADTASSAALLSSSSSSSSASLSRARPGRTRPQSAMATNRSTKGDTGIRTSSSQIKSITESRSDSRLVPGSRRQRPASAHVARSSFVNVMDPLTPAGSAGISGAGTDLSGWEEVDRETVNLLLRPTDQRTASAARLGSSGPSGLSASGDTKYKKAVPALKSSLRSGKTARGSGSIQLSGHLQGFRIA